MTFDCIIIGGGIVGLATAMALLDARPGAGVLVLEKEAGVGRHQTGHNSGVIHAGVYYRPGSLKARLCREGRLATEDFCRRHGVPVARPGKLIVATTPTELARMDALRDNARRNGIETERLDAAALTRLEPAVVGLGALHVAETGIVDYAAVAGAMARSIEAAGGRIVTGAAVTGIREDGPGVTVATLRATAGATWRGRRLVACAGLQSDRVARLGGLAVTHRIVPFRGEFHDVRPERAGLVRHNIYPVPDPDLPFLGIHLTPTIDGGLRLGPNAAPGFAREAYGGGLSLRDVASFASFPGFWRLMRRNARTALRELRTSLSRPAYLALCRRYCPSLTLDDLATPHAGIRAQAVSPAGELVHDFLMAATERQLHVLNAPSPAATSAIPIGRMIAGKVTAG